MEDDRISHLKSNEGVDDDLEKEIKEFEEGKAGVKGLVDSGIVRIPRFFYYSASKNLFSDGGLAQLQVPVIDLSTITDPQIVGQAREAAGSWGFFQIVNHGIPLQIMEEMLQGIRQFHEQPTQVKRSFYTTDFNKRVLHYSNVLLRATKHADWRDTLNFEYHDGLLDSEEIPLVCRKAVGNYMEHMMKLKETLAQLLSAALGLNTNYLSSIECMSSAKLACHYYPSCPEPELTMGTTNHTDPYFLTVLLQDAIGGLQVLHQNNWVDVTPVRGALIVNIGDLMQLVTNDIFKSVEHRVLAGKKGPRTSAACFLYSSIKNKTIPYGPIQELLNLENKQVIYKKTSVADFIGHFRNRGLGNPALTRFKQ